MKISPVRLVIVKTHGRDASLLHPSRPETGETQPEIWACSCDFVDEADPTIVRVQGYKFAVELTEAAQAAHAIAEELERHRAHVETELTAAEAAATLPPVAPSDDTSEAGIGALVNDAEARAEASDARALAEAMGAGAKVAAAKVAATAVPSALDLAQAQADADAAEAAAAAAAAKASASRLALLKIQAAP